MIASDADYYFKFEQRDEDEDTCIYGVYDFVDEIGSVGYGFKRNHPIECGRLVWTDDRMKDIHPKIADEMLGKVLHFKPTPMPLEYEQMGLLPMINYDATMWVLLCKELCWDYRINHFSLWYTIGDYTKKMNSHQNVSITDLTQDIFINLPPFEMLTINQK